MSQPIHALAQVDDTGADFDIARLGRNRRQQRHGRTRLRRKVVNTEIGAVDTEFVSTLRDINRVSEHLFGIKVTARRVMPEAEESKRLHTRQTKLNL